MNIFLPIRYNILFVEGNQKNCLNETVLMRTYNIFFALQKKKI